MFDFLCKLPLYFNRIAFAPSLLFEMFVPVMSDLINVASDLRYQKRCFGFCVEKRSVGVLALYTFIWDPLNSTSMWEFDFCVFMYEF